MPGENAFENRLARVWPVDRWSEAGVLVAFSGGPDSAALLAGLTSVCPAEVRSRIVAGHFNHRLRGPESEADAEFARRLAHRLGVECVVGTGDVRSAAAQRGDGLEAAARDERYRFLAESAAQLGLRYVATAHTLDDQAETVLHRILRGTGLAGLAGIPSARALADGTLGLVRPLLGFRRAEVLEYLRFRELPYCVDASNEDLQFTRNRIRRELLPQLARDYNPQIVDALDRLAMQAGEWREVIDTFVAPLVEKAVVRADAAGCILNCRVLADVPTPLVREVLLHAWRQCRFPQQAMGFAEWTSLATMVAAASDTKQILPGSITAERRGDHFHLTPSGRSERET